MLLRKTLSIALISLLFVLEAAAQSAGSFKISEVVVGNTNGLVDEYGNRPSWIEVANTSWGTVNLQNCYLTNNRKAVEDMPVRERVKLMSLISRGDSRTKLEAQERIVFFADGCTNLGTLHTNFKLVPGKENFIALSRFGNGSGRSARRVFLCTCSFRKQGRLHVVYNSSGKRYARKRQQFGNRQGRQGCRIQGKRPLRFRYGHPGNVNRIQLPDFVICVLPYIRIFL